MTQLEKTTAALKFNLKAFKELGLNFNQNCVKNTCKVLADAEDDFQLITEKALLSILANKEAFDLDYLCSEYGILYIPILQTESNIDMNIEIHFGLSAKQTKVGTSFRGATEFITEGGDLIITDIKLLDEDFEPLFGNESDLWECNKNVVRVAEDLVQSYVPNWYEKNF